MTRQILPNRRYAETFSFDHAADAGLQPLHFTATIGRHPGGNIGEVFLNSTKVGSGADASVRDAAIAVSLGLQYGVPLDVLRKAITRNDDGAPSSPIGKLLDLLEAA